MSDGDLKQEGRSPERPKDPDSSSPPVVRPVREILGENTVPLRISEPPKPAARTADGSAHTQVRLLLIEAVYFIYQGIPALISFFCD